MLCVASLSNSVHALRAFTMRPKKHWAHQALFHTLYDPWNDASFLAFSPFIRFRPFMATKSSYIRRLKPNVARFAYFYLRDGVFEGKSRRVRILGYEPRGAELEIMTWIADYPFDSQRRRRWRPRKWIAIFPLNCRFPHSQRQLLREHVTSHASNARLSR